MFDLLQACKEEGMTAQHVRDFQKKLREGINMKTIKVRQDQLKSIDPDYQGQEYYHDGERVQLVDGRKGIYRGMEKREYPEEHLYIVEVD